MFIVLSRWNNDHSINEAHLHRHSKDVRNQQKQNIKQKHAHPPTHSTIVGNSITESKENTLEWSQSRIF